MGNDRWSWLLIGGMAVLVVALGFFIISYRQQDARDEALYPLRAELRQLRIRMDQLEAGLAAGATAYQGTLALISEGLEAEPLSDQEFNRLTRRRELLVQTYTDKRAEGLDEKARIEERAAAIEAEARTVQGY
jgi:hypothetical protein